MGLVQQAGVHPLETIQLLHRPVRHEIDPSLPSVQVIVVVLQYRIKPFRKD